MDYKIFVIERAGFGDEFFIMLTRPEGSYSFVLSRGSMLK